MPRPNLVIFNPDSYRGDVVGHLGNAGAVTPNLDALVAGGAVSYTNAFTQNPVCTPSRCSFMTGLYPHAHGHRSMKNMLKPHEPHLLKVLRRHGYHVWWGGKNDLVAVETPEAYLEHCDTKYSPTEGVNEYHRATHIDSADRRWGVYYRGVMKKGGAGPLHFDQDTGWVRGAADFIAQADTEKPFCLFLPLVAPHPAYTVEEEYYDLIDPARLPPRHPVPERGHPCLDQLRRIYATAGVTHEDWLEIKRVYYAMCAKVDRLFGMVVAALKARGLYDNTLILFFSDHGDFTGDYNLPEKVHFALQDALLRTPLLIKPPAACGAQAGVRTHLTELVDLCPTVYDLLGIDPGYDTQGMSLGASLRGCDEPLRDAVFAEVGSRCGEAGFINTDVAAMPPDSFYALQSQASWPAHREGSYAVSCRTLTHKYVRRGYSDHHELYDLTRDPGECFNLSGKPEMAEVEQAMAMQLLDHFMRTADTLPQQADSRQV